MKNKTALTQKILQFTFTLIFFGFYLHLFHIHHLSLKCLVLLVPSIATGFGIANLIKAFSDSDLENRCIAIGTEVETGKNKQTLGILSGFFSLLTFIAASAFSFKGYIEKRKSRALIFINYGLGWFGLSMMTAITAIHLIYGSKEEFNDRTSQYKSDGKEKKPQPWQRRLDIYLSFLWLNLHVGFECLLPMIGLIRAGAGIGWLSALSIVGYGLCNYCGHIKTLHPTVPIEIGEIPYLKKIIQIASVLSIPPIFAEFSEHIVFALSLLNLSFTPLVLMIAIPSTLAWIFLLYQNAFSCQHANQNQLQQACGIIAVLSQAMLSFHEAEHVLLPFLGLSSGIVAKTILSIAFISGLLVDLALFFPKPHTSNKVTAIGPIERLHNEIKSIGMTNQNNNQKANAPAFNFTSNECDDVSCSTCW